jgi:hypothetical protein
MRYRSKGSEKDKTKRDREYRSTVPQQLVVWGSEDFIKKLGKWLRDEELEGTMLGFVDLLRTIRADLGYDDKNLSERDLMHLFLEPNSVDT